MKIYQGYRMRNWLYSIVLVLTVGGCGNNSMPKMNLSDPALEQIFPAKEIGGLDKIIRFMDSTAFAGCNCNSISQAYTNLRYTPEIFNQVQFDALMEDMKQVGLYQTFWTVRQVNDSVKSVYLDFNMNGNLFKLIERLSNDDDVAREYYGYLMRDMDISPSLEVMFPNDFPTIDVKRPAIRLLIASHLLFMRESKKFAKKEPIQYRIQDTNSD